MEFYVYETRQLIQAKMRPIIIITSNNEKELPDAFLRRCFFHYIRFPDRETLEQIVNVHYPDIKSNLVKEALEVFYGVRDIQGLKKKPSTSELLDWLKILMSEQITPSDLSNNRKNRKIPPLHGALLKNEQDLQLFDPASRRSTY
jgi:MoxR-like ATPase